MRLFLRECGEASGMGASNFDYPEWIGVTKLLKDVVFVKPHCGVPQLLSKRLVLVVYDERVLGTPLQG